MGPGPVPAGTALAPEMRTATGPTALAGRGAARGGRPGAPARRSRPGHIGVPGLTFGGWHRSNVAEAQLQVNEGSFADPAPALVEHLPAQRQAGVPVQPELRGERAIVPPDHDDLRWAAARRPGPDVLDEVIAAHQAEHRGGDAQDAHRARVVRGRTWHLI